MVLGRSRDPWTGDSETEHVAVVVEAYVDGSVAGSDAYADDVVAVVCGLGVVGEG